MNKTLVILAAGMGSRYGGLKQMEGFGPQGETLLEYNLHDAMHEGFNRAVFIIRESMEADFRNRVTRRLDGFLETEVVFQRSELDVADRQRIGAELPPREKPWGTGHALLSALPVLDEAFVVLNADDFYGSGAFAEASRFLEDPAATEAVAGLIAYRLKQTLSSHGSVSRGVLEQDEKGFLTGIRERHQIERGPGGIDFLETETGRKYPLEGDTLVSLNLLACRPGLKDYARKAWEAFLKEKGMKPKAEFGIPDILQRVLRSGERIAVVPTGERWMGVTHADDAPVVRKELREQVEAGHYPEHLWTAPG